jgi:hypothetical protein
MPNGDHGDSWNALNWAEWKGRVGAALDTLEKGQEVLFDKSNSQAKEINGIKVKAAGVGAAVAILTNLVFMLIQFMKSAGG